MNLKTGNEFQGETQIIRHSLPVSLVKLAPVVVSTKSPPPRSSCWCHNATLFARWHRHLSAAPRRQRKQYLAQRRPPPKKKWKTPQKVWRLFGSLLWHWFLATFILHRWKVPDGPGLLLARSQSIRGCQPLADGLNKRLRNNTRYSRP